MLFCLSLFPQMFPSFITLLTHLCPRNGSANSPSPGPQVPGAVCPDCHADTACCADAAGATRASDIGYVDSWSEQVYADSTIKWQHTFGSLPTHRHEKPVLFTFLWRLIDCSLTQRTVTVCKFPGRTPAQTCSREVSEKTCMWAPWIIHLLLLDGGEGEQSLPSPPLPSPLLRDPEDTPLYMWGVKNSKGMAVGGKKEKARKRCKNILLLRWFKTGAPFSKTTCIQLQTQGAVKQWWKKPLS